MSRKNSSIFCFIVMTAAGAACGYWGMASAEENRFFSGAGSSLMTVGTMILICALACYAQIILHEGGHLLCGLASGYRFCSFRIGKHLFLKEHGRMKRKTFTIAGTGGQCLMIPPDCRPEDCPYILYNVGGFLANFTAAALFWLLWCRFPSVPVLSAFSIDMVVIGLALGITNAAPMRMNGIANDGYNALTLKKDGRVRRALWLQLAINARVTEGARLRELDPSWFELSDGDDLGNPLILAVAHYRCERLMDQMRFEEAEKACRILLLKPGLLGQQRNELLCIKLFLELIGPCRPEVADGIYTNQLRKYIRATGCYVSRKRLLYAWELLRRGDEEAAVRQLEAFERVAADYPYSGDVALERELIEVVRAKKESGAQAGSDPPRLSREPLDESAGVNMSKVVEISHISDIL